MRVGFYAAPSPVSDLIPSGNRASLISDLSPEIIGDTPFDKMGLVRDVADCERHLRSMRHLSLTLLELGMVRGDSQTHWENRLPNAETVDIDPRKAVFDRIRVRCHVGKQQDRALLDRIGADSVLQRFDIIIDDVAHVGQLADISFRYLFENHPEPRRLLFHRELGHRSLAAESR